MSQYTQYKDTNYIILSDGRAARLLKPTKAKSGNQEYVNFIIGGKQERVNTNTLKEMFAANGIAETTPNT
jgi:hypothetical protein